MTGLSNAVATSDSCNRASFLISFVRFLSLQKYRRPGQAMPTLVAAGDDKHLPIRTRISHSRFLLRTIWIKIGAAFFFFLHFVIKLGLLN